MNSQPVNTKPNVMGSLCVSLLFVLVGAVTLFDTLSYSDVDSKVFPRAAAILLILASVVSIVLTLLKPVADEGFGSGAWWRRALLISAMLIACLLMPKLGFVTSSAVAFLGALLAAMHDQWTARTAFVYIVSGFIVVGGFYALFQFGLNVPLP